jgi:hypothetical protein
MALFTGICTDAGPNVISMKTAKALGLTIPQSILLRADQIID